jgi:hypothetical protein
MLSDAGVINSVSGLVHSAQLRNRRKLSARTRKKAYSSSFVTAVDPIRRNSHPELTRIGQIMGFFPFPGLNTVETIIMQSLESGSPKRGTPFRKE